MDKDDLLLDNLRWFVNANIITTDKIRYSVITVQAIISHRAEDVLD